MNGYKQNKILEIIKMSVQTVDNRWIENGLTQNGIKPVLNNAFSTLTNGPGYCDKNIDITTSLPGQSASANQIILEKMPYGPVNCGQYATLIKPGVNPLTLRGFSNDNTIFPVNDSPVCLESCDYLDFTGHPIHGVCSSQCIRNTTYCGIGSTCKNSAPGGLADWMGAPKTGPNSGTWGSAINNQIAGGRSGKTDSYLNPIRIVTPTADPKQNLMKHGFITQGCECQDGTSRIAGGTFYDWAQLGAGTGPFTLNTDSGISSEVWNGQGTCNTWQNDSVYSWAGQQPFSVSTCSLDIQKYAQTCAWCKKAVLAVPNVQPDQTYPPEKTTYTYDAFGQQTGSSTKPTYCTFSADSSGNYTVDNGDCLGFGANGKVRIPCNHPTIQSLDCPVTSPGTQMIGLFCNVPAANRLTGASCAFVQIQDLQYMTKNTGSNMNNYWITYGTGNFSVNLSGSITNPRSTPGTAESQVITGGRQIAITFPNGTTASALLNWLQGQSALTNEINVTISPAVGANANNPQSSQPPPISTTFNTSIFFKVTTIGLIQYQYLDSHSTPVGTGSFFDGPITIKYATGPLSPPTYSGWNESGTNVVNITFPNGTLASTIVNYLNPIFAAQTTQAKNLRLTVASTDGPQISSYSLYYYGFAQGQNYPLGQSGPAPLNNPGNCNVHLDGSIFTGTWQPNTVYKDPTSGTVEPWIGMQGIKCDYQPNQGSCQTTFWNPDSTGDCQICDSELWNWIPGGWEAVVDPSHSLHDLALTAYIPKYQDLKQSYLCDQTANDSNISSDVRWSIPFCGKDNGNNSCTNICSTSQSGCSKMSWDGELGATIGISNICKPGHKCIFVCGKNCNNLDYCNGDNNCTTFCNETCDSKIWTTDLDPGYNLCGTDTGTECIYECNSNCDSTSTSSPNSSIRMCTTNTCEIKWPATITSSSQIYIPTVIDNLVSETGGMSNSVPTESCPDMLCERNPVLTLRGINEDENNTLVNNWLNGTFDLTTIHGKTTNIQNPIIPDLRAYGQPDELAKRTIKALRCCLGVQPGFKSSDGGANGGPKTDADVDPYGGYEIWDLADCPPGTMCPSSDTCKDLFKSVLDGSNQHITMNLNDFGAASYPTDFSLDGNATSGVSEKILMNPAWYAKAYCELMSGGATKTLSTVMGLDDDVNTLCRKAMYNYCMSPVTVDVINDGNYWNAPLGATTPPANNANYSKMSYELPLNIFSQGCNLWFKNELQEVMPSDYGTRNMLLGSACQRLQVDGWINPVAPDQSPILQAFVTNDGKIKDVNGNVIDLSYVGSATATTGQGSIPTLIANTCNCFLRGSQCQGNTGSNCSYQYCGAGMDTEVKIDYGNPKPVIRPLNTSVDLTPYTNMTGPGNVPLGDSSWTRYQDPTAPSWKTGLDTTNFTCATGKAPQGMTISGDEAGGAGNCFTGCNYVNEYDICWNASPTNRKYSGELLGGTTQWNCDFTEEFKGINTCDPSKGDSYSCYGDCEHGNVDKNGSPYPSCGTQTWFDNTLNLNPGEIKVKKNRTPGKSDITDDPYWQNFYSGNSTYVSSAHIPGVGTVYNPSRSILSSDPYCNSLSSIKPYNLQFAVSSDCIISQGNIANNQGIITGSIGISNLGSCNISSIFPSGNAKMAFLTYMGATDCTGKSEVCWNNNSFCLTDGTTTATDGIPAGENCMVCGSSSDKNSTVASGKPITCCLDPSINSDPDYQIANSQILSDVTLGKNQVVSYFCAANSCPNGSTDLSTLVASCGTKFTNGCQGATDQDTCEGCDYCKWNNNKCVAACPTAPENGWRQPGGISPSTSPSTSKPTSQPTVKPTTSPSTGGGVVGSSLSGTNIGIIVVGIILGLLFLANLGYVVVPKIFGKGNGFGKSVTKTGLARGFSFGKRLVKNTVKNTVKRSIRTRV